MSSDIQELVDPLRRLHERLRDRVVAACEEGDARAGREDLAQVHREGAEDTIYAIDRLVEEELLAGLEELAEESGPLVLIAEGLPGGSVVLPPGASPQETRWRLIVDPIDGTRLDTDRGGPRPRGGNDPGRPRDRPADRDPAGQAAPQRRRLGAQGRRCPGGAV